MSEARDLAARIEMLEDALYYFQTFAHALKTHNNAKAAAVFSDAAQKVQKELDTLMAKADGKNLPKIAPWEKLHPAYEHPASLLLDAHDQMSAAEAEAIARKMLENL